MIEINSPKNEPSDKSQPDHPHFKIRKVIPPLFSAIKTLIIVLSLTFLIAAMPSLFSLGRATWAIWDSNVDGADYKGREIYKLNFHPDNIYRKPILYFRQLGSDTIFKYTEGKTVRDFREEAPRFFNLSLSYLTIAGLTSLLIGIAISLGGAPKKRNPLIYEILSTLSVIPDFVLILIQQYLFFQINIFLGHEFVRTSSLTMDKRAILLPIFIMGLYPTLYLVRTLGSQLKTQFNETYILYARSRGLSIFRIKIFHLGPAAIHYIKGDLHKILAILFLNLFISERMFNIKGLTAFLFSNIGQYVFTVNTIFLFLGLYIIIYLISYLLLSLTGKALRRELI